MGHSAASTLLGVTLLVGLVPAAAPGVGPKEGSLAASGARLALGMAHTCRIDERPSVSGQVRCFGYGYPVQGAAPVDLGPGNRAVAIAAGDFHTCAILGPESPEAGSVRCWGERE